MNAEPPPTTPDSRYLVVRGRLWRRADPALAAERRGGLVSRPMAARRIARLRGKDVPATGANQHWSVDFVHDPRLDGRKFRIPTVIAQRSRERVLPEASHRLPRRCVGKAPDDAARQR